MAISTGNKEVKIALGAVEIAKISLGNTLVYSAGNTVTYIVDTNVSYTEEVGSGDSCLSPKTFTPTKSGWIFAGWKADAELNGSVLSSLVMQDKPITLYAVFKQEITLGYYGNGATGGATSAQKGLRYYNGAGKILNPTFTISANGFTRPNYTFVNWTMSTPNTGTAYAPGAKVTLSANTALYAYWVAVANYGYTGGVQAFTAPMAGTYQLQVWGAQGGTAGNTPGGKGGYSVGNVVLSKGQSLYVCVGGAGVSVNGASDTTFAGGYNGGGSGASTTWDGTRAGAGGGGATHITTTNRGTLSNYSPYRSEILLVAGGGGGSTYHDWDGGNYGNTGGAGGGISGGGAGSGYMFGQGENGSPDDGVYGYGGGGGGYLGGYLSHSQSSPGGGSGYVGGVSNGSTTSGIQTGNGKAVITFISAA